MQKRLFTALILLLLLTPKYANAQIMVLTDSLRSALPKNTVKNIDSLNILISKEKDQKALIKLYYNLAVQCSDFSNDKALKYGKVALSIAEESGFKEEYAGIYFELARCEFKKGNYEQAKMKYELALTNSRYSGDKTVAANCYNGLGVILNANGQADEAVKNYFKGLKEFEKLNDKEGISMVYLNLAFIYIDQNKLDEAEAAILKSISIADPTVSNNNIPSAYQYLGIIYGMKGDLDEAICYINESVNLNIISGNLAALDENYNNLGTAYTMKGDLATGIDYLNKSRKIQISLSDKYAEAHTLGNIGSLYLDMKNYKEALHFVNESIKICKEAGLLSLEMKNYSRLSDIYQQTSDYKNAYLNHVKYTTLKDSIDTKEKTEKIAEQKIQYEYDKKAAIEKLSFDQEIESSKNFQKLLGLGLLFLLGLSFFAYRAYKIKTKSNIIITHQKEQLEILNAANENLIYSLSHDIKEPMLDLQLLIKKLSSNDEILNEVGSNLESQIRSVNTIVNNLVEIKKADTNITEPIISIGDIRNTVDKVIKSLEYKIKEKNISIDNALLEVDQLEFPLSTQKLYLLVLNLLNNAIRFSHDGQNIQIYASDDGICIRDFGTGISAAAIHDIEKNEKHDDKNDPSGGSGIGLQLVNNLLKNTKIKLKFDNPGGGGTIAKIQVGNNG
ncbi:MAG: tetratricopeptide repeat-containing sensor histidine kinase [Saprospiraceae bacterium]|nr:tetratricopeptide repeat-containing sensor histidine kinase [Saprospiraceae bacterium]